MNAKDTGFSFASTLKDVEGPSHLTSPGQTTSYFNPNSQPRRINNRPPSYSFNHFEDFGKSQDGDMNKDLMNVTAGS